MMRPSSISRALTNCTVPLFVPGQVAFGAVQKLELRAVGIHLI